MRLYPRGLLTLTLLILTWTETAPKKPKSHQCPLGFKLAYTDDSKKPVCYRLKDSPESFSDKFRDCTGNIFTSELYNNLNFTKTKRVIWTDFKSTYPGGLFVDWSYTDATGTPFSSTYDVKYDASLGIDDDLCVVVDPVSNFTAVGCNDDTKYYRYCFVKPYDEDDRSTRGCKGVGNYSRFFSPLSTCLTAVSGAGGGGLRATWSQALELCSKREGTLMSRGWRLSNSPLLNFGDARSVYPLPLGITMSADGILEGMLSKTDTYLIPEPEWHFSELSWSPDTPFGSLVNDTWQWTDGSYIFFHVICERPAKLENIQMELAVEGDKDLILRVNNTIKKNEIRCFTDSLTYYPSQVKIDRDDDNENKFHVEANADGYYWCLQKDYKSYHVSESNRTLFIKNKDETLNLYACRIRVSNNYRLGNLDGLHRSWKQTLKQFIYYRTLFVEEYGDSENITEDMLLNYKRKKELEWTEPNVIYDSRIKRLHLDSQTVLLHLVLNPEMKPLLPGTRMTIGKEQMLEVIFMRPAYICKGFESLPNQELGATVTFGCSLFTCVGDYNDGVQWVETALEGCNSTTTELPKKTPIFTDIDFNKTESIKNAVTPTALTLPKISMPKLTNDNSSESSEMSTERSNETTTEWSTNPTFFWPINVTTETDWSTITTVNTPITDPPLEITTVNSPETTTFEATESPTTTARPPEEQLQDVIAELEQLLLNDSLPVESLEQPFNQVNEILNVEDENFQISSDLLVLLDQLANRATLGSEQRAVTIRDNLAVMMADATPENPVRGIRVSASALGKSAASFANSTFDFIEAEINTAELFSGQSEAVVYLPASVTREARRISFVAFRNQRAFQSDYTVNSRVFSVNVENLTQFERGEVIDIHLTPLVGTPERDQRRVCAFWQFDSNGSGAWSRDGCRLIRATRDGAMDTCRCDHLTHFAEVLVPRTVFSKNNERALEILSVVGCCVSLVGLILVGLTAALFRSWRREYSNKIWLQLCVSIFLVSICFLVIVYADFDRYDVPCMLTGVILHYSVVASFCWMLVAAVLSYRRLVLVFTRDMSHKLLRAAAFAWGAPCVVVGVLLAVNPRAYADRFEELEAVDSFCYPTGLGLWLAVYAPIALILIANWTLFILIVRSVFASRRIQRHGDSNEALRCASVSCLLVFLFGLPWIIGLFAANLVMAYIFCLSANYQGFVLFIFFVVGNKKTRDLWLNKLKIKQTRKVPVTSSTYTNRSVGPGWRAGAEGASSIEAKTSKPRSLASPDDSRFS